MGQIFGQNIGSPFAIVTTKGELVVTGSVTNEVVSTSFRQYDQQKILMEILAELKILNLHQEQITGEIITDDDLNY